MPSIPFIQSERSIPGTSGGVYAPSEDPVSAAIVRSGALATKEADQFIGVLTSQKHWEDAQARAEQNAQRHVEALTFGHDLKNDVDTIAESYKGRTDYQKFEEDGQTAIDSLKAKYDGAITDPVVRRVFMPTFLQESYNLQKTIRDKKNEVLTEAGRGQWIIERDQALKNWVNAGTPEEKQAVADQFELTTQALVVGRILKPAEAETAILTFKKQASVAYAKELINADPAKAQEILSDKKQLPDLDPTTRQELLAPLTGKAKEQRITAVGVELTNSYGLDSDKPGWEGAIKELYKPENLTRWGITLQESQQIFSSLHTRWTFDQQGKKLEAEERKKTSFDEAFKLVNGGKFKDAVNLLEKSGMSGQDIYDFKQKVITDQRQDVTFKQTQAKDSAENVQKKAEKWLLNNVRGDQVGFALQTYRAGLVENNLAANRYEEYARQVAALPQYSKKTDSRAKLANALGIKTTDSKPKALLPTPRKVFDQISAQIKAGQLTRKQAEAQVRGMGYDPDQLEQIAK